MGLPLFHRDFGGTGQPPLVILHGMLGSSRNWQTAGQDLAISSQVVALDARNHGQSPHAESMDYAAMADDIIGWLDARCLPKVSLLGHSMGGKTAMLLACRHPDRVARLIVVDIAPRDYFWPGRRVEFDAMNALEVARLNSRGEAEQQLAANIPDWAMRKFITTNLERNPDGSWRWLINLPVLTAALPGLEQNPLTGTDIFNGPTQFVVGAKSNYVQPSDHAAIRQHFPGAKITTLAESGHNPHMEAREKFVSVVTGNGG
ncbi:MAG: alpha/beta fold hydrolase [Cephaloticoccus sp.]|nr:alpha/beta fold hydrolase [Cephaloticoccus sp.]MCF7761293.1 alpha/beta fold hydrolase [Cephaloticoccus sp.]